MNIKKLWHYILNIWTVWFIVCGFFVGKEQLTNYVSAKKDAVEQYKNLCLESGGSIRHEDSFLYQNIYCQKKSGDETVFYFRSPVTLVGVSVSMVNRLSFGILEYQLKSLEQG